VALLERHFQPFGFGLDCGSGIRMMRLHC